ncbi:YeiH family protein [Weissella cibaria]|uniref:YeiH family protein n=1 Tax=Weissella cibaria TaxID=137591 RepID=UPI002A74A30E|nr:putative sulfate exporter family transporter [Weissella cibaria]MDY2518955.1 putative sulfate exporter family transporter [Weissella cibaria]
MAIKRQMIAGILLTLAVALVAKFVSPWLPTLGAEALAMVLGIILGNTVFAQQRWGAGVKWAEKYPIEIGIAALGLNVTLQNIESLGWTGIIFILLQMLATILVVMWLGGRVFKVAPQTAMLMGAGNAVCGSSAIASVAPAVGATDDQRRTSVATVSLAGVVLLFVLPIIGPAVFPHNDLLVSALIGGTVQSVGQVSGTASLVGGYVVTYAPIFKMLRVIMLSVVVILMARHASKLTPIEATAPKTSVKIPWFVMVFVVLMLVNSFISLPHVLTGTAHEITSFFGIVNLAGIGLNLKWQTIKQSGMKFLGYGLVTIIFQVVLAIVLITVLMK